MRHRMAHTGTALLAAAFVFAGAAQAQSNINPVDKFAWGENIGFLNFRDANGGADGGVVLADHLRGWVWAENVGWINLGNGGGPYANTDDTNFGVNIDPFTGELSGFAWGENIGWINFGTTPFVGTDGARFVRPQGRFEGFAWGENVGWINLDDATIFVRACAYDLNGDTSVGPSDLFALLGSWGAPWGPADLFGILGSWGACP